MDLSKQSHLNYNISPKAEFRKPSIEAASRKYRRHSPVSYSSSSDGSPNHDRSSSPKLSKEDTTKDASIPLRRKDDKREVERDSNRSQYDRNGDYYRDVDRHSSRRSHAYSRHDDYARHDKHTGEKERNQRKSSSFNRESRTYNNNDHSRQESKVDRSREYHDKDQVKYSRDRYDGFDFRSRDKDSSSERNGKRHTNSDEVERDRVDKDRGSRDYRRDSHRFFGDNRSNRDEDNVEFCGNIDESGLEVVGKHQKKEGYKSGKRELDGQKLVKREKMTGDDNETNRDKDPSGKESKEKLDSKFIPATESSNGKKPKLFGSDKEDSYDKAGLKHTSSAVEYLSSKQAQEENSIPGKGQVNDSAASSNLSAAKFAAMKAAELVNKNLVGVGVMSTEQKKKLLWGNKKSNVEEEPGHRWDATLFDDRERQEKFNKLMGVKGDVNVENDGSDQLRAEKQKELQLDLEKQYTAGLRRRDGRTVGLGL